MEQRPDLPPPENLPESEKMIQAEKSKLPESGASSRKNSEEKTEEVEEVVKPVLMYRPRENEAFLQKIL